MSDPRARIVAADKAHLWHPYTPMDRWLAEDTDPLVIVRARGSRLFDADGKSYLDGNSSWWVAALGHNHPRIVAALARQAEAFCHVSMAGTTHEPAARLGEELCAVAPPGMERVFFSDDGSTAVELALKMSLQFWRNAGLQGKHRFVALDNAYHGDTLAATNLGGVEVFRRPYAGVMLECIHVPVEAQTPTDTNDYAAPGPHARAFATLESMIAEHAAEIAAIIVEPRLQGASGMRVYDGELLRRARAACDRHQVLLIADEVFTGYGRTGPMWSCGGAGVVPDILCTAKGFTAGVLPMSATLTTARIFDGFRGAPERTLWHGHSFCGNPLGAAVAREVLAVFREEEILARAAPKARRIAEAFQALATIPGVHSPRALGMMGAVDLAADAGYLGGRGWRAYAEARRLGAYLRPMGDVVYVTPPLNIDDAELEELLDIVRRSVIHALG